MILRDLIGLPFGNLWRIKLRSALTMSGVMVAIGAFVSMLSFGAGNQEFVTEQYEQLGLLTTMHVYPARNDVADSTAAEPRPMNDSTVAWLASLPGVRLAYPYNVYEVTAALLDTVVSEDAQAIPPSATGIRMFSQIEAGRMLDSDTGKQIVVGSRFLNDLGVQSLDSAIGEQVIVSVERIRLDSGLVHLVQGTGESMDRILVNGWVDSMRNPDYIRRVASNEFKLALGRFTEGFFTRPATVSDTLTIVGVIQTGRPPSHVNPLLIPISTARLFNNAGMSADPTELYATLRNGQVGVGDSQTASSEYPRITLQLDPSVPFQQVKDSVEAAGLSSYSLAEQFEEITRFFLYFDMALGLIGLIALTTASLGIVNTMVMSIMERRREIGVLMSLGASRRDIKILYLFESALIGAIGAGTGIILGWLVARAASAIAQYYMVQEGLDPIELFALPWWLVLIAFAFGLLVSIAAGAYPAARAARVDPMEALRAE